MTGLERYRGRQVGVLGLAASGRSAARTLVAAGAEVLGFDDRPDAVAAADLREGRVPEVGRLDLLVPSPGVPLNHPVVEAAQAAGVPVRGDVDLFAELLGPRPLVGVTGTNGKSTTTALIHHLLVAAGVDAVLGGNIGRPVFDLELGPEDRVFVLELSSYQLDLCADLRCRVAVWLNLTPDHLDRHGDLEGYIAAKRRIFAGQTARDVAVVGIDDAPSQAVAAELRQAGRRVIAVALDSPLPAEVEVMDGRLVELIEGAPVEALDLRALANLRGAHNWQNIAVAFAAVRALGVPCEPILAALPTFKGLPHRMEEVARAGRVAWVNDSKATNPEAAARSLGCYEDVYWIAGGRPKPGGFRALRPLMAAVREGYLIGEAAAAIAADLGDLAPMREVGTLEAAVGAATKHAGRSAAARPVVLLAPACASFDQFANFEARGEAFRQLATAAARSQAA